MMARLDFFSKQNIPIDVYIDKTVVQRDGIEFVSGLDFTNRQRKKRCNILHLQDQGVQKLKSLPILIQLLTSNLRLHRALSRVPKTGRPEAKS